MIALLSFKLTFVLHLLSLKEGQILLIGSVALGVLKAGPQHQDSTIS
jgi:hypothetical protein